MIVPQPQQERFLWLGHFFCSKLGDGFYLCMFRCFFSATIRMDFEEFSGCVLLKWNQHQKRSNGWPD